MHILFQIKSQTPQLKAFKTPGIDPNQQRIISPNLHFAIIVVTLGRPVIVRTVQRVEKTAKNCGIANQFAKLCRKSKIQCKPKPRVNNLDDTSSEAATIGTSATKGEQVNQIDAMMQKHSIYDAIYDFDYDEFDDNCVAIISDSDNFREVESVNMPIHFVNTEIKH